MPPLSQQTFREIIDILTPHFGGDDQRRALLISALGLGHPLLSQIDYTGNANTFTVNLVSRLNDYGQVAPGQTALWAVLEEVSRNVGYDKQQRIKALAGLVNGTGSSQVSAGVNSSTGSSPFMHQPSAAKRADDPVIIFISHKNAPLDNAILDELNSFMKHPVEAAGGIIWYDRLMEWGMEWDKEIKQKMEQADIALLFISQGFLSSDYINKYEIPAFLRRREQEGLRVLPLIISESTWDLHDWLPQFSALPDPQDALRTVKAYRQADRSDEIYTKITRKLVDIVKQIRSKRA
jgi:hypothetical protein